jgi:hypothetical protein
MYRLNRLAPLALLLILTASPAALGRADKPKAELRVNEAAATPAERFYVEIAVVEPLNDRVYQALECHQRGGGGCPDPEPRLGYLMQEGSKVPDGGGFVNVIKISPTDAVPRTQKRFRIYLPEGFAPFNDFADKDFRVHMEYRGRDEKDGKPGKQHTINFPVALAFEREVTTNFVACGADKLAILLNYTPSDLTDPNDPKIPSTMRIGQIRQYFQDVQDDPARMAKIKIEVEAIGQSPDTFHVRGLTLNPQATALNANSTLSICFDTDQSLPGQEFDVEFKFEPDVPAEVALPAVSEGLEGVAAQASPEVFASSEKGPGVRAIDKDLNIAGTLSSSVSDVEKDGVMVRERTTRGTLDVRLGLRDIKDLTVFPTEPPICQKLTAFTPPTATTRGHITIGAIDRDILPGTTVGGDPPRVGALQCLHFMTPTNPAGDFEGQISFSPRGDPIRTSAIYRILTPAYLDAKVSTGKITEDTLSLNRIVIGSQLEYQYRYNNATFPTYYRFIFKGTHASDRDFKQAEYKGSFEFRPLIGKLYRPLDLQPEKQEERELAKKTSLVPVGHGYEITPVIGFELGRTYMRRRPAEAVEPSDTVRRLYFGLDMVFNPTPNIEFLTSDTFYVRGESEEDRYRNYFLGEFSYKLGDFASKRFAHSVFFSFERGGQPPFDEADVNALKFGYRITADTLFTRFRGIR